VSFGSPGGTTIELQQHSASLVVKQSPDGHVQKTGSTSSATTASEFWKRLAISSQKVAEANAQQLHEIEGLKAKLFRELTQNAAVQGNSVEGIVQAAIRLIGLERKILGLDDDAQSDSVTGTSAFLHEYERMLERVKGDSTKSAELMQLQKDRLLLEAKMRELAAMDALHDASDLAAT
jgi:hypothetical protein